MGEAGNDYVDVKMMMVILTTQNHSDTSRVAKNFLLSMLSNNYILMLNHVIKSVQPSNLSK